MVCEHRAVTETHSDGDHMHAVIEEELASLVQVVQLHPAWKLVCQIAQSLGFHWFQRRLLESTRS